MSFLKSIKAIFHRSSQTDLSLARVSQEFVSMFMDFRSRLQMSLNRSCGLPAGRFPSSSSPYRMSFGILPSSILQTCPSHRRRRCFNREYMLGRFALSRTSVLETLSCQAMFKMRLRLRRWKVLSLCSCRACSTQDSLPYRSVLSTQALLETDGQSKVLAGFTITFHQLLGFLS